MANVSGMHPLDGKSVGSGYEIAVVSLRYCANEKTITSNQETISSPLYPSQYPNGVSCGWIRQSEYPQKLVFEHFDLENSVNCSQGDYVERKSNLIPRAFVLLASAENVRLSLMFVDGAGQEKRRLRTSRPRGLRANSPFGLADSASWAIARSPLDLEV
ncbi:Cubilin [Exaiptasia diaphana]|nr:Cubilin [Exaiptasia diaphana]